MFPTVDAEDIILVTSLKRKTSVTSDEPESYDKSQVENQNNNKDLTSNMLIKEIVFCFALILTTYGALHNTPTKISKVPHAVRFFHRDSVVTDWYRGQLNDALSSINVEDISFVMYYAPWDAESQYVRGEFEKAANIMRDRVHFAAINCWNPGSECRLQHNKIPSWPILMAYTVTSRGVLYKGPRNAESMINFLELMTRPLQRVSSTEDLVHLLSICDAVAVGFTPLSTTSRHYNIWYNVALKSKEFDTVGEICFAVVTSTELAHDLGVESTPRAHLMLWNNTKEYILDEENRTWNESTLMHWVLENFIQPVARIIPMWKKSFSFERYADGNPMLILFTPLNPIHEQLPAYALLREVAMEYYNCKNSSSYDWIFELTKLQQVQRLLYQSKNIMKFCKEYKYKTPSKSVDSIAKKEVVSHNNKYPWNNVTQKSEKSGIFNFLLKQGLAISKLIEGSNDDAELWSTIGLLEQCGSYIKPLPAEKNIYENYEKCQSFEEHLHHDFDNKITEKEVGTTMLPVENDHLSAENLIQDSVKHYCKLRQFAHKLSPPVLPAKVTNTNVTHIHGLSCATNYSLYVLAIDSVNNYHFAEALGVDIKNKKDMTAAVILDSKHETQYILSEEYSAKSLRDFIYNFTQKRLKRFLRSQVEETSHTHYFGSHGNKMEPDGKDENAVFITELTTRTFRKFVRTPDTTSLVMVCDGACPARVVWSLAAAARLLRACGVRAAPGRLDAARHDLPWHYAAHKLPALLVFPAGGELESRAYPAGARVSSAGLVALALRALGVPQHLRVRLALCQQPKENNEKKTCLKDIKEHISTVIERNLKYWRRTNNNDLKVSLFRRLQHLHQVSLLLNAFNVHDLKGNNIKQNLLIEALEKLSQNWEIHESLLRTSTIPSPITR